MSPSFQLAILLLMLESTLVEASRVPHSLGVIPAFVGQRIPQKRERRQETLGYLPYHPLAVSAQMPQITMDNLETSSAPITHKNTPQEHPWSQTNMDRCRKLWNLGPAEMMQLTLLHDKLTDFEDSVYNNPFELVRFIKEYKGDLSLAESKFRAMIDWRQKHQVDKLLDTTQYVPPSLFRYFPAGVLQGTDRDGDPIHCERTGAADSHGLLHRYGRDVMLEQAIWIREAQRHGKWNIDYEAQHGHPVKQFTVVLDMHGLKANNMSPSLISIGQQVSRIVQDYYPGYSKRIIVIRAPTIFQLAFSAMKPFIDESMRQRITISSASDPRKILGQYMDLKVLPKEICEEGQGQAVKDFGPVVWQGGKIPDQEELPSIALVEQQKPSPNDVVVPTPKATTTPMPEVVITEASVDRTPAKRHMRIKPVSWIRMPIGLFQTTFSCLENHGIGHPYAI